MSKKHHSSKIFCDHTLTLGDFWSWAYSDLFSNTIRPLFAEFLVGVALGVIDKPRIEWNAYDFLYKGKKIEVKSAAYLQSWNQSKLSIIRFDIGEKDGWSSETNKFAGVSKRNADCYVFCLYPETDIKKANPLNTSVWRFYVLSTEILNHNFRNQKSVGLKKIEQLTSPVSFATLKTCIDTVLK